MGMCLDGKGRMSVEVRRTSFIIHPGYGYTADGERHNPHAPDWEKFWLTTPHPEFDTKDLDDLIAALEEARDYLKRPR